MQVVRQLKSPKQPVTGRQIAVAAAIDAIAIVVFAAIGRREHDEGGAVVDVLETAAPFLIGLALAWLIVRAWRHPLSVYVGLAVWPITVLAGMILRNLVFDRGTAAPFVVVATLFIGACLVGWRLVWRSVGTRRGADAA
ncbi:MAG: DUF3054 domain-containing protein [Ilumatobacteraceae bacterium]